jgi:hypothetical protein
MITSVVLVTASGTTDVAAGRPSPVNESNEAGPADGGRGRGHELSRAHVRTRGQRAPPSP